MTGWDWFLMGIFLCISKLSLFLMLNKYLESRFDLIDIKLERLIKIFRHQCNEINKDKEDKC